MSNLHQWLEMGGYALYIWPAYGLVCAVLLINVLRLQRQRERTMKKLQQWFKKQ